MDRQVDWAWGCKKTSARPPPRPAPSLAPPPCPPTSPPPIRPPRPAPPPCGCLEPGAGESVAGGIWLPAGQRSPPLGECRAPAPSRLTSAPYPHWRPCPPLSLGSHTDLSYPPRRSHHPAPGVPPRLWSDRAPPTRPVARPVPHEPPVHPRGLLITPSVPLLPFRPLPSLGHSIPTNYLASPTLIIRRPWTG